MTKLLIAVAVVLIYLFLPKSPSVISKCPDYTSYASTPHPPYSNGPLKLPFMRPSEDCRTFHSDTIESIIDEYKSKLKDPDLARLFENAFPNTLDTTIQWHDTNMPRTFISTGDIPAEWLRDSARQLSVYQKFITMDESLLTLIKGAILQQAEYIIDDPYCNAFQPPKKSKIEPRIPSFDDVTPRPDWSKVFECKWELDSLASFLTLTNDYIDNSRDFSILDNELVTQALITIASVLKQEMISTFQPNGELNRVRYTFKRTTNIGSETLPLSGYGNPLNAVGLIRSSFRPSDDACIFQYLIPSNAHMYTELTRVIPTLKSYNDPKIMSVSLSTILQSIADSVYEGIEKHAIVNHPIYGDVYAYEIDGFGGVNLMDDANIPSLLSLADVGYLNKSNKVYQNTRKMILSSSNPYYIRGKFISGIGGPHVGLKYAWPMSILVQIRTSDDEEEITKLLEIIKTTTGGLGLIHEGVKVNSPMGQSYTRPWFSWANSEFAKTIIDLGDRKPWLIFHDKTLDKE